MSQRIADLDAAKGSARASTLEAPRRKLIRAPHKLLALTLASIAIILLDEVWMLAVAAGAAFVLVLATRAPRKQKWSHLRAILVTLIIAGLVQWLFVGPTQALSFVLSLAAIVLLAAAFSLSTSPNELLEGVQKALTPVLGSARAERLGLMTALTMRTIPLMVQAVQMSAEARKARGLERSARALLAPTLVRVIRQAFALGEALRARGLDDPA